MDARSASAQLVQSYGRKQLERSNYRKYSSCLHVKSEGVERASERLPCSRGSGRLTEGGARTPKQSVDRLRQTRMFFGSVLADELLRPNLLQRRQCISQVHITRTGRDSWSGKQVPPDCEGCFFFYRKKDLSQSSDRLRREGCFHQNHSYFI